MEFRKDINGLRAFAVIAVVLFHFNSAWSPGGFAGVDVALSEYQERQLAANKMQQAAVQKCGVTLLDPLPYLCDGETCHGEINGIPLYFDDDHLSSYGSNLISPIYDEVLK